MSLKYTNKQERQYCSGKYVYILFVYQIFSAVFGHFDIYRHRYKNDHQYIWNEPPMSFQEIHQHTTCIKIIDIIVKIVYIL